MAATIMAPRQALEAKGRALGTPQETGCPPGYVFLSGDCVPARASFSPGMRRAVEERRRARVKVVRRG